MKLFFSQARKRREQNIVRFCETLSIGAMLWAIIFTVLLLSKSFFR